MLQFLDGSALDSDTIGTADTMVPAQILGFVKHESRGFPTPIWSTTWVWAVMKLREGILRTIQCM